MHDSIASAHSGRRCLDEWDSRNSLDSRETLVSIRAYLRQGTHRRRLLLESRLVGSNLLLLCDRQSRNNVQEYLKNRAFGNDCYLKLTHLPKKPKALKILLTNPLVVRLTG